MRSQFGRGVTCILVHDYLLIRRVVPFFLGLVVILCCGGVFAYYATMPLWLMVLISPFSVVSYLLTEAERSRWGEFVRVLPVSDFAVVISRYIEYLMLITFALLGSLVSAVINDVIVNDPVGRVYYIVYTSIVVAELFYFTFLLPIISKWGSQGFKIGTTSMVSVGMIAVVLSRYLSWTPHIAAPMSQMLGSVSIIGACAIMISSYIFFQLLSLLISTHLQGKKHA